MRAPPPIWRAGTAASAPAKLPAPLPRRPTSQDARVGGGGGRRAGASLVGPLPSRYLIRAAAAQSLAGVGRPPGLVPGLGFSVLGSQQEGCVRVPSQLYQLPPPGVRALPPPGGGLQAHRPPRSPVPGRAGSRGPGAQPEDLAPGLRLPGALGAQEGPPQVPSMFVVFARS